MRLSERGLQLLRAFEGLRLTAYKPVPSDPWTIGFGSTRYADGRPVREGDTVTPGEAEDLLRATLRQYEDAVNAVVTVPITQPQYDALVSFAYNVGTGALRGSTLLKKLNAGDYKGAADEFLRWDRAGGVSLPGLQRRRRAEREAFLSELPAVAPEPAPIEQRTFPPAPPAPQPESKPMAPAITVLGALLPSLVNLIPELGKLFGSGSAVAERNVAAAEKVAEVVVAATRAPNLQGAIETMQSDPAALEAARDAVRREWFDLQEKSIQQRQEFVMRYQAQTNVRTVIGRLTFVEALSVWLAVSGTLAGWYVLWAGEEKFGNQIIGSVVTLLVIGGVVAVRDFWIGTSVESRRKTDMLAERDK